MSTHRTMTGRLSVLTTSSRLPAGLLSYQAWQLLGTGFVCAAGDSPLVRAVRAVGVEVTLITAGRTYETIRGLLAAHSAVVFLAVPGEPPDAALLELRPEVVTASWDPPGARLLDVVTVMDRLRSPGGCPWDREQTHESLMPYLLEETYEAYQALEDGDLAALREELGDVLLQVAFHARLAEELPAGERWSVDDVAADLVAKLVRRHPHVFADARVDGADEVVANWNTIKTAEKQRQSVTDGVPLALPALALGATLHRKASRLGVPADLLAGDAGSSKLGERLMAEVASARAAGEDPEVALRTVARLMRDRVAAVERSVRAEGGDPSTLTEADWRSRWS